MLKVSELERTSLPIEFIELLPTHCDTCGEENEITETLTILRCPNHLCGEKVTKRLVALMKDIGVKNLGDSKCRQFLNHFGVSNPYIIFLYDPSSDGVLYDGCSSEFSQAIYEEVNKKRTMLLWEYIRIGNLPGVRDSARKLFSDYDDLEDFYSDLEDGGVDFIQELLGIGTTDEFGEVDSFSVRATAIYETLLRYKDDLFLALDYVNIKELKTEVLNVCISRSVGSPYKSKQEFISTLNNQFSDKIHLNFLNSVTNDCDFLIWNHVGSPTSKVKKAMSINDKRRDLNIQNGVDEDEGLINVMTGIDFYHYLESL